MDKLFKNLETPLFIGRYHIKLKETDSTNAYLMWALDSTLNYPEGTTVSTTFQTAGRGQRGTIWQANAGDNILLSILLYPKFLTVEEQFYISQVIALGVHDFIQNEIKHEEVLIKWPNDILVNGLKIAGILIENSIQAGKLRNSIAGIGINMNDDCSKLPFATSLKLEKKNITNLEVGMQKLFVHIETRYLQLKQGNKAMISNAYLDKLYGLGKELTFYDRLRDEKIIGIIKGVNLNGNIQIETARQFLEFGVKEIQFLDTHKYF